MKNLVVAFLLIIFLSITSACSIVEGIFKAGMSFGIFLVVALIVVVLFFVFKFRRR
jgi:hypothetical protein